MEKISANLPTKYGQFKVHVYKENNQDHIALVKGNVKKHGKVPVRIHSQCLTGDILGSLKCDCGDQLTQTLEKFSKEKYAVLIYLKQEGRGIGLFNKIKAYDLQEHGLDTVDANTHLGFAADERTYDIAAKIIKNLKLGSVKLLTNNPKKVLGLEKHGIVVDETISIKTQVHEHNKDYLDTKRDKMGHDL